ncbi:MFS transporter [Novosphingobium sp. 9]|uniref:MFS transporter n=1 Tax=Novosphingobium sp. 9 TaxID=2025349 RepID=UPI0028CB7F4D|nr:MFS transporter [Novosphingobium sp. 9]
MISTNGMVVVIGYQLYDVARGEYGMSIARAAFALGVLGLVQFLPLFVLTPVAGVVADRFDRRRVATMAMMIDMVVALGMALITTFQIHNLGAIYAFAALHGAARVFVRPAMAAIAPNVVPVKVMPRAIAMGSMAMQIGTMIGPATYGFLFATHPSLPYWATVAILVGGSVATMAIRQMPPPPEEARRTHPVRQIVDGFVFVWKERFLLGCITLDLFAVLLGGATALLPIYARDILHVGAEGLGPMRSAPAIGAAIVAILFSVRPLAKNVGIKMLVAVAVYGAATVAFGLSWNYWLSLVCLAGVGAADMYSVFIRTTLTQLKTPDEMRGRVSAISGVAISASNELGEMQSGLAASLLGPVGAVVFGGVGAIVVTGIWAWGFPELRRARSFSQSDDA